MAEIFTPWQINQLTIPNRLLRSATWEGTALDDGTPTENTANITAELAEGGVGLIITGYAFVLPWGKGLPHQTGAHIDAMVGPLTRISDAVHKSGGLVAMQIVHAGGQTKEEWIGQQPIGPSAMVHPAFKEQIAGLSKEQIFDIIEAFALAAARVKAAGFDAVQLHGAHGYLINQFLSPDINQRSDEYGGSLENRARFGYQVYQAVRDMVGPGYPVFIKLNSDDCVEGGLTLADAVEVSKQLSQMGMDAIEVSGGVPYAGKLSASARVVREPEEEGYFYDNAKAIKAVVSCPVISVGGWRSRPRIEQALEGVDAVALSRPFIRQPHLARHWQDGGQEAATCISCRQCFDVAMKQGLACKQEMKDEDSD
ncbi:MAG: NADH:flavin oxidoreductase [Desulfarculaceae bacterium]|jgi:2,4-dienoyl-CoA reductase-like NADH-dependent reductase (Old Yellow Enzyme family)